MTFAGKTYTDVQILPIAALEHEAELRNVKEATCTDDGYTGDSVCKHCGKTLAKGEVVKATGHNYKNGKCVNCGAAEPAHGVKTGDESRLALWIAVMALTALLSAAAAVLLRKKRNS